LGPPEWRFIRNHQSFQASPRRPVSPGFRNDARGTFFVLPKTISPQKKPSQPATQNVRLPAIASRERIGWRLCRGVRHRKTLPEEPLHLP
ncbi:hypothetical protein QOZ18_30670, partial [Pseudomonas aeruginosa]|uniref:hypothetical protein n=1 Tax=Pseudomonas aeruginosa TaxID=287 RepID=UPI0034581CBA